MNILNKNETYKKNNPIYLGEKEYSEPKEYFKIVVNQIQSKFKNKPISLIDVGCAAGGFIFYAKNKLNLHKCVGFDISDAHLKQAKEHMPEVDFIVGSLKNPFINKSKEFDVCTCLGTISIFDEIDDIIFNLISLIKPGGAIYIYDLINDYPVDVLMRYRIVNDNDFSKWKAGFNIRSLTTYKRLIKEIDKKIELSWVDFEMPFQIPKTSDPLRSWTIKTENKKNQIVVGTGQMLNFKIICMKIK